jgi:hypothetical protein
MTTTRTATAPAPSAPLRDPGRYPLPLPAGHVVDLDTA